MNLDLHVHSVFSGDSSTLAVEYARRMIELKSDHDLSGFILMEHNHFIRPDQCDLAELSREYGLVILSGVEVDTYWGHLLVYGMTDRLWESIESSGARKQEPVSLAKMILEQGALAVPAHPFRFFIGIGERCRELAGICAVEGINGSNSEQENKGALALAARMGWCVTGGSDAHFTVELGKSLTSFPEPVRSMADVVSQVRSGKVRAISLEEARIQRAGRPA